MNISLFITCFNDTLFPETGKALVKIFRRLGYEVEFPLQQTCCGQMHYNTGYQNETLPLLRKFVDIFLEADAIVAPSASCVAMIKEFYPDIAKRTKDSMLVSQVSEITEKVFEFSQFLVEELGIENVGSYYPHRVTYHPTCHSLRMIDVNDAPLKLLSNVRGIDLVRLKQSSECCGFGGTFAIKNADTSVAILGDKIRHIKDTGAEVCTSLDNSCLMHIDGALNRQISGIKTLHLAEILACTEE